MAWETVLGRSLAFGCHPVAAWPRLAGPARILLVAAYGALGYSTVLAFLLLIG
jgi:hypothetical protein